MKPFNTISVIGLGYIGLPTAAMLASRGIDVIGVDVSQNVINTINQGKIHIVEPDLDAIVHAVVTTGRLKATLEAEPSDAFMIAVPTPLDDNNRPDLSYIRSAAQTIAPVLQKGNLVVLESTSPVGTTEKLVSWLSELRKDLAFPDSSKKACDIHIAHCPERVLPGKVLFELVNNDRIIGGITPACALKAKSLYKIFVQGECIITSARIAEMTKLTENTYRDVNIAFANELSMICEKMQINVWELIQLANRHPRVNILNPGPGVGGHCIAVDPWFIVDSIPEKSNLIRMARQVNLEKPQWVIRKVLEKAERFKNPIIACFGLTFKANIDDIRESPSIEIVKALADKKLGSILAVEPHIKNLPSSLSCHKNIQLVSIEKACQEADIIVMLVNHEDFWDLDHNLLQEKIIIDTQGIWQKNG